MHFKCVKFLARKSGRVKCLTNLMSATMLTVPLSSFLLLSMIKTWHMLRVFGIRKGALVELLHDFFRSLQKISGYANTDISDIFRILYNIFGQQILPVDGRKGRPLSPKNKRNHQLWCLQSWISLINQIKSLPSAWHWLETLPGSSSHWWYPSHRIWRRRPQNTHHCWN